MPKATLVNKLYLMIGCVAAALLVLALLAVRTHHQIDHDLEELGQLPQLQAMLAERTVDHYRWVQGLGVGTLLLGEKFAGKLDPRECALGRWYHAYDPPAELAEAFRKLEEPHARMHASAARVLAPFEAGDVQAAKAAFERETMPALLATQAAIAEMGAAVQAMIAEHAAEGMGVLERAQRTTLAAYAAVFLLLVGGAILLLVRPLRRTLGALGVVFGRIGAGDLTARAPVRGDDELARLAAMANAAVEQMQQTIVAAAATAADVRSTARQLASTSQSLSSSVQEQAASLEQTTASLAQMADGARQSAGYAGDLHGRAEGAFDGARQGGDVVQRAVTSMRGMSATATRIGDIVATMDEMAFQTNLLALNAAVEAARAGEQGRSFAVVAGEVRALAQRSAAASREVKALIGETVDAIGAGAKLVEAAGTEFAGIVGGVQEVAGLVGHITTTSREQATSIAQVSQAIAQIDTVTQSNAAQSEELSAAAESLANGADELSAQMARFTVRPAEAAVA